MRGYFYRDGEVAFYKPPSPFQAVFVRATRSVVLALPFYSRIYGHADFQTRVKDTAIVYYLDGSVERYEKAVLILTLPRENEHFTLDGVRGVIIHKDYEDCILFYAKDDGYFEAFHPDFEKADSPGRRWILTEYLKELREAGERELFTKLSKLLGSSPKAPRHDGVG